MSKFHIGQCYLAYANLKEWIEEFEENEELKKLEDNE